MNKMTRKEQLIEILDKYSIRRAWIKSDESLVESRPLTARDELADAILALPIDVPGDDEILMTESPHLETKAEAFGFRVGATWMRDEIIKRNRP